MMRWQTGVAVLAAGAWAGVAGAAAPKSSGGASFDDVPQVKLAADTDSVDRARDRSADRTSARVEDRSSTMSESSRVISDEGGAEDPMEDMQSFNTYTSLEDGQPGQPGEVQINYFNGWETTSGESDPWLMNPQLEITLGQSLCSPWRNTKLGIAVPLELMNGGVDGNGDLELEWIQRWITEKECEWWPTFSTVNLLRVPSGYHSEKVDWTLTGVLAKNLGPGTAYLNAWLKSANGDNNLHGTESSGISSLFAEEEGDDLRNFQWGFRLGYKWRINDHFALVSSYAMQSSELRGWHNQHSADFALEWRVNDALTIGPGITTTLDGNSDHANFGAGVMVHYEFFPFKKSCNSCNSCGSVASR